MIELRRVLLVRFSSLGDVLLTTPLVRALRERLPGAQLDYFTKGASAPLLHGNTRLNEIHVLEDTGFAGLKNKIAEIGRNGPYDLVVDLHRNPRSWYTRHSLTSFFDVKMKRDRFRRWLLVHLGVDIYGKDPDPVPVRYFSAMDGIFDPPLGPDDQGLEIFLNDGDRSEASEALGNIGVPLLAVSPSAHWPTKRWLPERFAEAGDVLAGQLNAAVALLGGPEDAQLCDDVAHRMNSKTINLAGKLSIRGTAAVMERSQAFIGNDTGLMHIASALGKPGAAVFGPTTRHLGYYPYRSRLEVVETGGLKCRPCTKQGNDRCPRSHFKCMADISVEEVVEAAMRSAGGNPK